MDIFIGQMKASIHNGKLLQEISINNLEGCRRVRLCGRVNLHARDSFNKNDVVKPVETLIRLTDIVFIKIVKLAFYAI